ncbi:MULTISPECIES: replication initiator protein A [unclassified Mesorhizobium]|uniref:replication initiator protein A n=1 Tax=unclassified Mesorhizobium TaxID=325217 RepID=UPI000FD2BD1A|nr:MULTISPECIES: replication initiator protein A [unclassified Mesorhizobium]RUV76019.1 replication protein A [Mesorhizobium sp. M5C.F.Ca.IN.020.14.1.1]RUV29962.1 replication protein A [Mesorhizobium sp. M5C.F.Ca.IN.020.32.2.1]RWG41783.1 MAG: replication protein A [Mesorhizobium sp.]RWH55755.1 MAG: replication protein A [Mesorhizobium sp.]RWI67794.1 MAG: replication protein A [Mesorhizobium sp.]
MTASPPQGGERAQLNPFEALSGDVPPRDQQDLMAHPFFSLSKSRRVAPIHYKARDVELQVYAVAEHGMATIWDADILIWAASQILAAQDRGLPTSRFFRFTPYQLLNGIGRTTGARSYFLIKGALTRLQSTVIRTTIRHSEHWRRQQFSWINEWEELAARRGRVEGMEFVLPEWLYQGIIDRRLVLAIDPDYFSLTGGIERWLYRIARKHAGRQADGWRFELRHLHAKSGSLARYSDFAIDVRAIARRQPLPGYLISIGRASDGGELVHIHPVEKLCATSPDIRTSGAAGIRTSGANLSVHQAHGLQLSLWQDERNRSRKESKEESKSYYLDGRSGDNASPSCLSRRRRGR